jgi:hypothetical protein
MDMKLDYVAETIFIQTTENVAPSLNSWTVTNYDPSSVIVSNQTELTFPEISTNTEQPRLGRHLLETIDAYKRVFTPDK